LEISLEAAYAAVCTFGGCILQTLTTRKNLKAKVFCIIMDMIVLQMRRVRWGHDREALVSRTAQDAIQHRSKKEEELMRLK